MILFRFIFGISKRIFKYFFYAIPFIETGNLKFFITTVNKSLEKRKFTKKSKAKLNVHLGLKLDILCFLEKVEREKRSKI